MAKKTVKEGNDVFTALLALTTVTVLATTVYVGLMCYWYYGTLFSIVQSPR
ncbi:MAG: hypothetical protein ISS71_02680 [Phycisphaerae bacterium]|nr:hypothetical protein [Phycisphaerae bacterium]